MESKNKIETREKFEWSNLWWEEANIESLPRVLLIGDSITVGYRPLVQNLLRGRALVDQFATSHAISDKAFMCELSLMLCEYPYRVIHLNNGLHGWHVTEGEYRRCLGKVIALIGEKQKDARLVLVTTTPVSKRGAPFEVDLEKEAVIAKRNAIVADIAAGSGLPVDDLYRLTAGKPEIRAEDGYHYKQEGQALQAAQAAEVIGEVLGKV